jgi:hypothetical protein
VFKSWRWPNPILLTKPHDAGLGLPVWNAHHVNNLRQVAPVITPAYPAMNSTLSVSRQTLQILHEEFCRGHEILDRLWKDHQQGKLESGMSFQELFQPSDFFISYPLYLSICIVGPTESDAQSWTGFVESRMRKLVSDMLGKSLPLSKIQLWPKKVDACVADRTALLTHDQRKNSVTYFVGFHVDKLRMRGNQLDIERQMQNFSQWELSRFQPLIPGMDVLVKNFKVKELPLICFEIYEGGKFEAMRKRRKMRDADPRRQQAKKNARLEELNARLEEMKRKKQEAINAKEKKRKREENEEEEEGDGGDANANSNAHAKAECEEIEKEKPPLSAEEAAAAQEEEALLENALDAIQNETGEGKTREEAEQDRQKLLSGELLVEGGGDEDEDALAYGPDGLLAGEVSQEKVLSIAEREAEVLRKSGYTVVSEDEFAVVGGNMVLPWRIHAAKMSSAVAKKERSRSKVTNPNSKITFKTKFDVVELDADGFVIDKGDDDFSPTPIWLSRRPGFEFKLGERGLGYYRTGKKVVVPSHTAY